MRAGVRRSPWGRAQSGRCCEQRRQGRLHLKKEFPMGGRIYRGRDVGESAAGPCGRCARGRHVWAALSCRDRARRPGPVLRRGRSVLREGDRAAVGVAFLFGRQIGEQSPEVVLEHWGGDAEMLTVRSSLTGAVGPSGSLERARVAARTVNYYDLDSLQIAYPDGTEFVSGQDRARSLWTASGLPSSPRTASARLGQRAAVSAADAFTRNASQDDRSRA